MSKRTKSLALVAVAVLSGCGGGGGGGPASTPVASTAVVTPASGVPAPIASPAPTASPPVAAPAPVTPPATPPVVVPPPPVPPVPPVPPLQEPIAAPIVAPATLLPVSETLPSLAAPQAGSTAAIGAAGEGLWVATAAARGLVFVDAQERHLGYQEGRSGNVPITWNGTWQFTGSSWSFAAGGQFAAEQPVRLTFPLAGTGTFNIRTSFVGAFGSGSGSEQNDSMAYAYSVANALAVTPGDLVGRWSSASQTLTIAANGTVSGSIAHASIGACAVTGRAVPTYPGSAKNMFDLTLAGTALQNNYCDMEGTGEQVFKAAITFTNTSPAAVPFYRRSLTVLGVVVGGWSTGELLKD